MKTRRMACCGVQELERLGEESSPTSALLHLFKNNYFFSSCAHFIFTAAVHSNTKPSNPRSNYGEVFKKFILGEGLGTVVCSEWKRNPNTLNWVRVYVWTFDRDALLRWKRSNQTAHPRATPRIPRRRPSPKDKVPNII